MSKYVAIQILSMNASMACLIASNAWLGMITGAVCMMAATIAAHLHGVECEAERQQKAREDAENQGNRDNGAP